MPRLSALPLLVLATLLAAPALAAPPVRDHDLEPDDYFSQAWIRETELSPDGGLVAYTELRWDEKADKRLSELWVVSTRTRRAERLTFDGQGKWSLQWSPDSRWLYFAASYQREGAKAAPWDGETQVWRLASTGGDPIPMTRVEGGLSLYELSHDGRTITYTKKREQVDEPHKDLKSTHSELEYGHGVVKYSAVHQLDLQTWRDRELATPDRVITDLAVSPNGARVALVTKPDESLLSGEGWSRIDLLHVEGGAITELTPEGWRASHPSPRGWVEDLAWSADDRALAFTVSYDGYQTEAWVLEWLSAVPALRKLSRPDAVSVEGGHLAWRGKSRDLLFLGQERARKRLYAFTDVSLKGAKGGQGKVVTVIPGDVALDDFGLDASGRTTIATIATPTTTPDVYEVGRGGRLTRLTHANPQVDRWRLPRTSIVTWRAEDGTEVEGVLELPPGYEPKRHGPIPMVVEIHGGPTAATLFRLRFWIYGRTLLPAKGYAVLSPNYRGSTGYGDRFLEQLVGHENDIEVRDILAGVDAMVARGIADPERLGVMGWSNGGYLTNCIIARTTRFKAASSGAGVLHQVMQWGLEDTPGHVINFMQGLPWDDAEAYRKGSPLYDLDKVKTPTLIHMGEGDARVPLAHARTLHRALHTYLGVPTELVIYPGAGHGLSKYSHRKAKMLWDLAWFAEHLGPGWAPEARPVAR